MVDLIIGLLDPVKGDILVDEINIKFFKEKWFSNIGYVPQSIFLNDEDIIKNISFYQNEDEINKQNLSLSIKISQLNNLVNEINNKKNSNIGERGIQLSGGQNRGLVC